MQADFPVLEFVTAARFFLLVTRYIENAISTFALNMGKTRRCNAQRERLGQVGTEIEWERENGLAVLHNRCDSTDKLQCFKLFSVISFSCVI